MTTRFTTRYTRLYVTTISRRAMTIRGAITWGMKHRAGRSFKHGVLLQECTTRPDSLRDRVSLKITHGVPKHCVPGAWRVARRNARSICPRQSAPASYTHTPPRASYGAAEQKLENYCPPSSHHGGAWQKERHRPSLRARREDVAVGCRSGFARRIPVPERRALAPPPATS